MTVDLSTSQARSRGRAPQVGETFGHYQLLLHIASGGMGQVWAARQMTQLGFRRVVAVKTALPEMAKNADFEQLFLDEARIASMIHHPNVCAIYELGEERGILYLAMEWVNGGSLLEVLEALPAPRYLEARLGARVVANACAGLHAAHELEGEDGVPLHVVHRDVSPQNILISADGHVKVADFGVAKARGQLHSATVTGEFKGKVSYLAPEQLTSKEVDRRADIFALGCVLYQVTVGQRPFQGDGALVTMYQILESNVTPPRSVIADYPEELEAIILRALARDPAQRFSTAEEMQMAIETWLAKTGPVLTEADIGAVVKQAMGGNVDTRQQDIRLALEQFAPVNSRDAAAAADGAAAENEGARPTVTPPASSEGSSENTQMSQTAFTAQSTRRRAGLPFWPLALVGLLLSAGAGALSRKAASKATGATATAATATLADSARGPSGKPGAEGKSDYVTLTIRAVPATATLTIDDGHAMPNPYVGVVPKDGQLHTIRAQAGNFVTQEKRVLFDQTQSMEFLLTPVGGATLATPPAAVPVASLPTAPIAASPGARTSGGGGRGPASRPGAAAPAATPAVVPPPAAADPKPTGKVRRPIDKTDPLSD